MKIPKQQFGFSQKILVLSVLAAFGSAHADEEEIAGFIKPDSAVSVGWGIASGDGKDRAIFGQYNGLRTNDASLLLDFDVVRRNDTTGLWTNLDGRNLGLDNREVRFSQNKQGDWKYFAEYNEMVRHDPRTINTNLQGAGTTTPSVMSLAAGTGANLNLDLKRKGITLGAEKWLTPNLLLEASFKNEDKDGARPFGIGLTCSNVIGGIPCATTTGALLLLPEPINSTTRQFEAKLNFSGEKFMLTGGYYGSFFTNANGSMKLNGVTNNLYNPDGLTPFVPGADLLGYLQQPLALPPDNQAHQLYVSGNYAITPTTRATFKYAYTHATQNENFGSSLPTLASVTNSNLGGVMDTQFAQLGVTARPMAKLSVLGNLRYEEKEDKTPIVAYNVNSNGTFTNTAYSSKKLNGKAEASYQLPENYRATLGIDYAWVHRDRPVSTSSILDTPSVLPLSGLREDTNELGYRAELRRSLSDTLNAAVGYVHSMRDGYRWSSITPATSTTSAFPYVPYSTYTPYGTYPMTMMDRKRDVLKVSADWTPTSDLSLQFMVEDGKDKYTAPTEKGLHDTGMKSYGIDAALNMSENWKLTGYVNQGTQILHVDNSTGYIAELENVNTSLGFGVVGRPSSRFEMGGDLSYMNDSNRYKQGMGSGAAIIGGGLPDVTYRVTSLKLFGKYAMQKNADVRVDLIHQKSKFDEWSWAYGGTSFTYSDNTTVSMQASQSVTFLGASYIYKFR